MLSPLQEGGGGGVANTDFALKKAHLHPCLSNFFTNTASQTRTL